jgi:hypothetical protein
VQWPSSILKGQHQWIKDIAFDGKELDQFQDSWSRLVPRDPHAQSLIYEKMM